MGQDQCWVVCDPKDDEIKGAGPTQLQAWLSAVGLTGRCFTWEMLRELMSDTGYFAAEIRNARQSC